MQSYLAGCKAILQIAAAKFILGKRKVTFQIAKLYSVSRYRVRIIEGCIASVQKSKEKKSKYSHFAVVPSNKLSC